MNSIRYCQIHDHRFIHDIFIQGDYHVLQGLCKFYYLKCNFPMNPHVRRLVVGWSVHLTYELQRRTDGQRRGSLPPTAFRPEISKSLTGVGRRAEQAGLEHPKLDQEVGSKSRVSEWALHIDR